MKELKTHKKGHVVVYQTLPASTQQAKQWPLFTGLILFSPSANQ